MRAQTALLSDQRDQPGHYSLDLTPRQARASIRHEQRSLQSRLTEASLAVPAIFAQRRDGMPSDWHDPLFPPLSVNLHPAGGKV